MTHVQHAFPAVGGENLSASESEQAWSDFTQMQGCHLIELRSHEAIYYDGDPASRVYEVVEGAVMLYKLLPDGRRQVVDILKSNDLFGYPADDIYDCSAESLTGATIRSMDRAQVESRAQLQFHLNRGLRRQLQDLHEHTVLLGRKSAFERVASFLMRFVPNRGGNGCAGPRGKKDDWDIVLAMTRQEIADFLGLTIETVSRVLSEMKRRELIRIEKQDRIYMRRVCDICKHTGIH